MSLTPAYGRDYKSKAALLADWNDDKDFTLEEMGGSTYINRPQADRSQYQVRYGELRRTAMIRRQSDGTWTA